MTTNPPDHDPFERETRAAPDADPASGPAGLWARIATARVMVPLGVALAAVIIVVVAGGTLLRQPVTGTATTSPKSSATPVASTPAATPATPVPSTPVPSTPVPSTPVLITPAPEASASASAGAVSAVPADFQPVSVTFVSASRGWVLGAATCDGSPCAVIARTTDGGLTWTRIPAPDAPVVVDGAPSGVRALRFASTLDGWAFGPDLWTTHDGGGTWHREALPGGGTPQVMALEAGAGTVHVAFWTGEDPLIRIASGPIGDDTLGVSPTMVQIGAGPVPQTQIVLHGTSGWLVQVDRDVVAGARLVGGSWQAWDPPCLGTAGPAWLAASSASSLIAGCDIGLWSTPQGVHLFTSTDGGATFAEQAGVLPITALAGITTAPSQPTIVAAGSQADGSAALIGRFSSGGSWTAVATLAGSGAFSELGFTTNAQGVAIAQAADGTSRLLMTRDGGRTWAPVGFAGG